MQARPECFQWLQYLGESYRDICCIWIQMLQMRKDCPAKQLYLQMSAFHVRMRWRSRQGPGVRLILGCGCKPRSGPKFPVFLCEPGWYRVAEILHGTCHADLNPGDTGGGTKSFWILEFTCNLQQAFFSPRNLTPLSFLIWKDWYQR